MIGVPSPAPKKIPKASTLHGETRIDEYAWMRDRTDPDLIAHLEAENAYADAWLKPGEELRATLYSEMLARIKEDDESVPVRRADWFYYTRTEKGKSYALYCRKHGSLQAPESLILDANVLASQEKYFRIGNFAVSPDQRLLAYSVDTEGDEAYTIRVKNLDSGELLPDEIPNTYYGLAWAEDSRTIFYTVLDEAKRPYRVYRHVIGVSQDTLIYQEDDARFEIQLSKTRSRAYIFLNIDSPLTSEVRYLNASDPSGAFVPMLVRQQGVEYDAEHHGGHFYIRTNEGAPNFRLMRTPVEAPSRSNWIELIGPRDRTTIESVDAFQHFLVLSERDNGLETIRIARIGDLSDLTAVDFPEQVYTASLGDNPEFDTSTLRLLYSSLATPASVFDYDMATGARELRKQTVVHGYDAGLYHSERLFARAPDGVEIPLSLVYRKGIERNGNNPTLLYGYGSYGLTSDPAFSSERLSLLDRGYVYAIAHIRGGGDMGKYWHDSAKLLTKMVSFTDFIASAEHLLAQGFTSPELLAINGGSAGGLLMGAVINLRPELFGTVVTRVPFVDAVNTMLDPTLPLTIGEYEEWGNPEQEEFYRTIRAYSPYDNVAPRAYPSILVRSGINDPRVAYWEPAKWVAKLRESTTSGKPILLKMDMGAGHFGPSGRYDRYRQVALDYSFLLMQR